MARALASLIAGLSSEPVAAAFVSVVIIRVIKDSGVTLITRIAGLLLSAIAVQLVANGVTAMVKAA